MRGGRFVGSGAWFNKALGQGFGDFGGVLAQREDVCCASQGVEIDIVGRIVAFALLRGGECVRAVFEVFEGAEVAGLDVLRVLQRDEVFSAEIFVADEIFPQLRFDVQPFDRVVGEDVAGVSQRHHVRVVRENFVCDRINHLSVIVLRKVELHEFGGFEGGAIDRVRSMLQQPRQNVVDVEDGAVRCADGGFEGLEGDGAEVEWESFEGRAGSRGFCKAGACAGGECILRGPFAVGDLDWRLS